MIRRIHIKNFKSVADLELKLGRINVLIGENGCGKSNILEGIAFYGAASNGKLDNEFLVSRGIRLSEPRFMRSAFPTEHALAHFEIEVSGEDASTLGARVVEDARSHYGRWTLLAGSVPPVFNLTDLNRLREAERFLEASYQGTDGTIISQEPLAEMVAELRAKYSLDDNRVVETMEQVGSFLIYSPENSSLRTFEREGQILPLGIKGEGLFRLLRVLSTDAARFDEIKKNVGLLDWFEDLQIAPELAPYDQTVRIRDRFVDEQFAWFDQRSSNEGFLFLLFYFALFVSGDTPAFFAIDNVDASLNPKTGSELMRRLSALAEKYGKQVIFTTHNPAVLDGLNLHDDEQRLFVVQRNRHGHTQARRVNPPQPIAGEPPVKLSEAFLRGLLGGLPQNF